MPNRFYKKQKNDNIWWVHNNKIGILEFSFDKVKVFNLFHDYPYELTDEQKTIFDKENPYWAEFFADRSEA